MENRGYRCGNEFLNPFTQFNNPYSFLPPVGACSWQQAFLSGYRLGYDEGMKQAWLNVGRANCGKEKDNGEG